MVSFISYEKQQGKAENILQITFSMSARDKQSPALLFE